MYRYTTPTLPIKIEGIDYETVDLIRIAIEQKGIEMLKEVTPEAVDPETSTIYIPLTQEETAALSTGFAEVQARIKFNSGAVLATNKVKLSVNDVLDEVII